MFKRYKGPYDQEKGSSVFEGEQQGMTSSPGRHQGAYADDSQRQVYQNPSPQQGQGATEIPPRIYDGRTPASPTPAAKVRLQEFDHSSESMVEEDDLFSEKHSRRSLGSGLNLSGERPETTLGEGVIFKGELTFQRLLRIDGQFEGELNSSGKLIVGPNGIVKSDVVLKEAIVDGKVEGNIKVERIELRCNAEVRGNIEAKSITVDEGVTIIGQVSVTPAEEEVTAEAVSEQ